MKSIFSPRNVQGPHGLIAHALGGIEGHAYTNSLEAFQHSRSSEFQIFEVDLAVTADDRIVCYHELDGKSLNLPAPLRQVTAESFSNCRYAGRFTPLDMETLLDLFHHTPGAYLVTDTKDENQRILPELIHAARDRSPALVARIIPQAYSQHDLDEVSRLSAFDAVIFTGYLCDYSDEQIVHIAASPQVAMVALSTDRYQDALGERIQREACGAYVHTVNDPDAARRLRGRGAGVYTDFIVPGGWRSVTPEN